MAAFDPEDLYRYVGDASVAGPMPLILMNEGWIEASDTLGTIRRELCDQSNLETIAEFNIDELLDMRVHRPTVSVRDGVPEPVKWPRVALSVGTDNEGTPFLLLHGPEPDLRWRPFAAAVAAIATGIGVSRTFIIGAYPAPVPHTRPMRISHTASRQDLLRSRPHNTGELNISVGVHFVIAQELEAHGIETLGIWAQVPYYLTTIAWPQAACGLFDNLELTAGLRFAHDHLATGIPDAIEQADRSVTENPSLKALVADLEERFDEMIRIEQGELPTGDELEEQVQQYLRNIDGD